MTKKTATAQEIQAEIQRRIKASDDLDGDCRGCGAPTPWPADKAHYDGNWTVHTLPGLTPGCREAIERIVREVRAEYDLRE